METKNFEIRTPMSNLNLPLKALVYCNPVFSSPVSYIDARVQLHHQNAEKIFFMWLSQNKKPQRRERLLKEVVSFFIRFK